MQHILARDSLKDDGDQVKGHKANDRQREDEGRNALDLYGSSRVGLWKWCRGAVLNFQKLTQWFPALLHIVFQQQVFRDHFSDTSIVLFVRRDRSLLILVGKR